jgi:hypothetical protein
LGWAGNVTLCGKEGMDTDCWWGNLKERDYLQDTGVNEDRNFNCHTSL